MVINSPTSPPAFIRQSVKPASEPSRSSTGASNTDKTDEAPTSSWPPSEEQQVSQLAELQKLKNRDREVRAHEMAHISAGGQYVTSGAQFSYQKGSDGQLYAVGGEVGIDTAAVPGDPRATMLKAQTVMRAALAPSEPSSQDRQVAASAAAMLQQARAKLQSLEAESESVTGQLLNTRV